jgi:hypothetical protein
MEQSDVRDLRSSPRFVVREPITGYFGGIDVAIRDMAVAGMQIEHAEPLKLSLKGKVGFKVDNTLFAVPGVVVWSKLSNAQAQGQLLYHSGIKLEDEANRFGNVINILMGRGRIAPDVDSLERKRRKIVEREQQKMANPILTIVVPRQPNIPADQLLLIQHARERLRSDPEEATRWYNRAKYAMGSEEGRLEELNVRHREEVFAVWEYLERSIDLATVARAFGIKKIG